MLTLTRCLSALLFVSPTLPPLSTAACSWRVWAIQRARQRCGSPTWCWRWAGTTASAPPASHHQSTCKKTPRLLLFTKVNLSARLQRPRRESPPAAAAPEKLLLILVYSSRRSPLQHVPQLAPNIGARSASSVEPKCSTPASVSMATQSAARLKVDPQRLDSSEPSPRLQRAIASPFLSFFFAPSVFYIKTSEQNTEPQSYPTS